MCRVVSLSFLILISLSTGLFASEEYTSYLLNKQNQTLLLSRWDYSCTSGEGCIFEPLEDIGPVDSGLCKMARTSDGTHYAINCNDNVLVLLDVTQGTAQPVCTLEVAVDQPEGNIAFDSQDRLWLTTFDTLHRIDLQTGMSMEALPLESPLQTMAFHKGHLYGGSIFRFVEVDLTTGNMIVIADYAGPWGSSWFHLLASDGDALWGISDGFGEPGPSTSFLFVKVAPDTGDRTLVSDIPKSYLYPFGHSVIQLQQQSAPAVPNLGMFGALILIVCIASAGAFILRIV